MIFLRAASGETAAGQLTLQDERKREAAPGHFESNHLRAVFLMIRAGVI
jgi:hypothetical protein